jgi:hypothetical protein
MDSEDANAQIVRRFGLAARVGDLSGHDVIAGHVPM